jgi:hypothetical protein
VDLRNYFLSNVKHLSILQITNCQAVEWKIRWDENAKWMACIVRLGNWWLTAIYSNVSLEAMSFIINDTW